jgi:hypothetical protein
MGRTKFNLKDGSNSKIFDGVQWQPSILWDMREQWMVMNSRSSERLAQLDSTSSMLFLLLMVIRSSAEVGLKAQIAIQISKAPPGITFNTFKAKIL